MKLLSFFLSVGVMSFASAQNPVVVELFTSQGCSSCPAADKNLSAIVARAEKNGQEVLALSFHVDYWNYIGWKDPYSRKEFTERQKTYASLMNLEGIYTPQMIVNGRTEFVGSNEEKSVDEVNKALKQSMPYEVSITDVQKSDGKIVVFYSVNKVPVNNFISFALVNKNVSNDVTKGENSGRKLAHTNVVRSFATLAAQKTGSIELSFSPFAQADQLIILMQNQDWHVTGASRKNL